MADINKRTSEYRKLLPLIAKASGDVGSDTVGEDVQALVQALEARTLTAGDGLTGGGNLSANRRFDVGAGNGITVNADDVALTTPGTLNVGTINDPTGNHKHAITTSSNPGAAQSILASNPSGYLQLVRLGLGISPSYPLHVSGESRLDGDLTFVGAQSIHTTADVLTLAPAADLDLSPGGTARVRVTNNVRLQSDNYASQTTGWGISYAGGGDFRSIYTDEMHVRSFIGDLEQALAGGQIISKSVAVLAEDFTVPAPEASSNLLVEGFNGFPTFRVFVDGDLIRLRQFNRTGTSLSVTDCWGTVAWSSTVAGTQTYTFTRSASPNGGGAVNGSIINAGTLALDYGTTGNGFLESNAIDGAMAENAPYHQVVTWTTHPNDTLTVRTRLGNLKGIFNVAGEYGLYAGVGVTDSDQFLRISNEAVEAHNLPIKMYDGANTTLQMTPTIPSIQMGDTLPTYNNGTGLFAGKDGSYYKFFLGNANGNKLLWDGMNLKITGSVVIGAGTGFTTDALLYLPLSGGVPHNTSTGINTNGHLGQPATQYGDIHGIEGKFGKALVCGRATTNLYPDPAFDSGTAGWNSSWGDIRAISSERSKFGANSLKITEDGVTSGTGVLKDIAVTAGNDYTVSVWIYVPSSYTGNSPRLSVVDGSTFSNPITSSAVTERDQWIERIVTVPAVVNTTVRAWILGTGVEAGDYYFIDGVQIEAKSAATPFVRGSRSDTYLRFSPNGNIKPNRGSFSTWVAFSDVSEKYRGVTPGLFTWWQGWNSNSLYLYLGNDYSTIGLMSYASGVNQEVSASNINWGANEWHHVVLTWGDNGIAYYIDGVLINSRSTFTPMIPDSMSFFVFGYCTLPFDGYMKDIAVLDRELAAGEVESIYKSNAPLNVTTSGNELMLTNKSGAKVWGHSGGLFAKDANGKESFALFNESMSAWGNDTDIGSGDIIFGRVAADYANMKWDASTGKLLFRGNITPQVEIGTDGKMFAGGGKVWLDKNGASIHTAENDFNSINSYKFMEGTTLISYFEGHTSSVNSFNYAGVFVKGNTRHSRLWLEANSNWGSYSKNAEVMIHAYSVNNSAHIQLATDGLNSKSIIALNATEINVSGQMSAGNAFIVNSGQYKSYKNSTTYTGYLFVPLTTPLTSTSWDGDARSTTAKTKIDLSAVFGVPAGVKAVEVYWAWQDSGSAGTNCWLCLSPNNTTASGIFLGAYGQANDKRLFGSAKIPCDANGDIYYQIAASGTGTMDVWLQIWGYYI